MAELATYIGTAPLTIQNDSVALVVGTRLLLQSTGLVVVAGASIRGDYVSVGATPANGIGPAFPMQDGAVPALVSVAVAIGDPAYSAASGQFTNVSTNAVLVGKFKQAAASGTLSVVLLETVA